MFKKLVSALLVGALGVGMLVGCGSTTSQAPAGEEPAAEAEAPAEAEAEAAPEEAAEPAAEALADIPAGSVNLSLMLPLGQWTDNFNDIIDAYKAENPEIGEITATFPSSDKYVDLLVSSLSAGELPNIIGMDYGIRRRDWWQYCEDLTVDTPAYELLTDEQIKLGTVSDGEYGMIMLPIYMEGSGILYNMRLLGEVGWDHTPQTRDELGQLAADLQAAGITPFMHQWAESYLNLANWVGTTWLGDKEDHGISTLAALLAGEDVDLANDVEWNEFLDTYEQVLIPYAQEGAISTDKWTCRNAFFAEECAMLVGEGSWETSNIQNANEALLEYVKQDVLPISNDASKNNLQISTICASVTKNDDPAVVHFAKDFLSYIVSSETARVWHQEKMGNPTAIESLEVSENLPKLPTDTLALIAEGKSAEDLYFSMPQEIYTDIEENWSRFVAGAATREEFTARYEEIFKNLANGFYD